MEDMGMIAKVQQPKEWCAGMVVVPKQDGRVRICVDLTRLNENVKRERHPLPAVDHVLAQLAGAKVFSKLDANSGFRQIPLDPALSLLTTFITPFGHYCFHRLPFGILSAPKHFQRRMEECLKGLSGLVCMMDDTLVHGRTRKEHDKWLQLVLERLRDSGMTLNSEKCQFAQESVKFLGHVVDSSGIRPHPSNVSAIQKVPAPTSVGEVRRLLGMVNQLSKFSTNLAEKSQPLRELLVKRNTWAWGVSQQRAFHEIKKVLTASPVLALFDPNLPTVVSADTSSFGLGAVLLQIQPGGERKPLAYVSRSMTPTEGRYAQIEKEALAFTWACELLPDYLIGMKFHIETDHKPFVPPFSSKHLEELPIRVQRFRMRMMRNQYSITHVPGKHLAIADTLSRAPVSAPNTTDETLQHEAEIFVDLVMEHLPATEQRLEEMKRAQAAKNVCRQVSEFCLSGWPDQCFLSKAVKPYFPMQSELSVQQGLLMRGNRIVIPPPLRKELLEKIHDGHQGIDKCRGKARQSNWWPGISRDLEVLVHNCQECLKAQEKRSQPLIPSQLPELPWKKVATDLFEWENRAHLLIVDYYSRYVEIAPLNNLTATEVITRTKSIFARHGIPETVFSDNGPQYSCLAYPEFAKEYEFKHVTSSPHYPQSNGEAERVVRTIKQLLKKSKDPYRALLAYRTAPLHMGYSPSELLMSRVLRSTVPTTRLQRAPRTPDLDVVRSQVQKNKAKLKRNFDARY